MNTQFLIQLLINGLVVGTLYGVVAMSFVLIYKATQVVNFAQGELLLVGAWVCWALLAKYEVPFWIGMPHQNGSWYLVSSHQHTQAPMSRNSPWAKFTTWVAL